MRSKTRALSGCLAVALAAGSVTASSIVTQAIAALPPGASVFQPLAPCRVVDTRLPPQSSNYEWVASTTIRVRSAGSCGIPDEATAVSISVTVTNVAGSGFVTVWPSGQPMPTASNLNVVAADTRSNGAIVQVGTGDTIDVFTSVRAAVIVDVNGAFIPSPSAATIGRFVPVAAERLVDTRTRDFVPANGALTIALPTSVPPGAIAVAVNITAAEGSGAGFLTAYPAGGERPTASVLTTAAARQTRAAGAIVPVTASGFTVYTSSGSHIVVDISGYFTGGSAERSTDGLFVPTAARRLIDTRLEEPMIHPGGTIEIDPVLPDASFVAVNWTMVDTSAAGFVTVYSAGTPRPTTSTANATGPGEVVANLGFTALSTRGAGIYSSAGTDLVADIAGWFTGAPAAATLGPAPNGVPTPRSADQSVAYIGDSLTINDLGSGLQATMRGLGWDARIDGRPSRNMVVGSTPSGLAAVRDFKAQGFDPQKWVISLGTNDIDKTCPTALGWDKRSCFREWIGQVLAAIGPGKDVLWVNVYRADSAPFVQATDDFEGVLREFEARAVLRVIDFLQWARAHPGDFRDNVHLYTVALCQIRIRLVTDAITSNFGRP